ncbi:TonB-dependent receptor domain-containing protein [Sphingomonas sp. BK580]|uniref:TonB-dependent receptor domain-containing protein n=1 Tax=Sphingomonas sp. BK580 TaxID=2586972 RepID=UPI00161A7223|nr:TonB-dependent receptor [Sphingomonas sp. BK580]MBB3691789.1 outer membrane receptor protein involved in Fe transport [Sphingomonas sp. BK580]
MLNAYRSRLLASTLLVGAAVIAAPATAQTADPASQPKTGVQSTDPNAPAAGISSQEAAPPAGETSSGDIVVTGTLIRNPNLVSSSPVSVIGAEEIQLRQRNTAEELLRDLPGVAPSIGSSVNNGNGGSSYVDLRGLGNFRNVVLLDGARITPSSTVGRVDLNNIPLALIERTDVLTGGAATTYGADAVSGVVNFITRSDFSGMEANVSQGITEQGDGASFRADLTLGANFDDGRGNAVVSFGYQDVDPVYQGARDFSRNNYTSTSGGRGGSGTTVPGRFTLGSAYNTIVPDTGTLRPYVGSRDGFNFNPYNVFQTPFKRYNIYGAGHYELSDKIEVYGRGMFSKNTVSTIIAPSGVFGQLLTIPVSNPYLPAAARAQFCANNDFDPNTAGIQTLTAAQCAAAAAATSPSDPNFRTFTTTAGRRFTEVGPRVSDYVTTMFDYRAGIKLGITNSISLDLSGAYGESENRQTQSGYVLISRLRSAVYATNTSTCLGSSPAVLNPNPALPPLANAGAGTNAGTGCVPVNIFGADGSISPNQIPYLTAAATTSQNTSLAQARALLSGDLGASLPWASEPIGFAVGAEYRKYTAQQFADELSQTAGELGGAGGATPNYRGSYDVKEGYAELIAPLVSDKPFFHSLTIEGGVRYSSYKVEAPGNPSYDTWTYKGGGSWEPADGLKLRGNYQRAVRAPNIAELFSPLNTGLTSLAVDPCRGANPVNNAALRAVCLAQGAPVASIGTIANPTAGQANSTTAGSTTLRPETSDSYTIGAVFQPNFLPGFTISVDYYNISIRNAISQPVPGDLVTGCFGDNNGSAANVNNPICGLFRRNPVTGALDGDPASTQGLLFPATNSGKILTDGIDLGVNYRRDLGFAKLNLSFNGNWTNRSKFQSLVEGSTVPAGNPIGAGLALPTTVYRECVGFYSGNCGSPGSAGPSSSAGSIQPEFTWNQRTTVSVGDVDLSLLWRHLDAVEVEPGVTTFQGTIAAGVLAGREVNFGKIPAYNYFDLSTRFGVSDNFDLTVTVTNLFDKQPPLVGGTVGATSFNSGNTYPSTYDALGRRFNVGARIKF